MNYRRQALNDWITKHHIEVEFVSDRVLKTAIGTLLLIEPKSFIDPILEAPSERILGEEMCVILSDEDISLLNEHSADYFLLQFGTRFYYFDDNDFVTKDVHDRAGEVVGTEYYLSKWKDFLYIGAPSLEMKDIKMSYLGIHGPFDLCNGSRSYKDWCTKAKWLGIESLGICEDNTLAGALEFQNTCEKFNIKSIIGETITVKPTKGVIYTVKLYVQNDTGWKNLLRINSIVNTSVDKCINEVELVKKLDGLVLILTPSIEVSKIYSAYKSVKNIYYQLTFSEFISSQKDSELLNNLTIYFKNFKELIPPVLIYDSYYLESDDSHIHKILWNIGKRPVTKQSRDQWFKTLDEIFEQALPLFKEGGEGELILIQALENTLHISNSVDFLIPTGKKHLPNYELSPKEKELYGDAESLFWALIEKGLEEKVISKGLDVDKYLDRVQEEVRVINLGQVRDYFLIVWDILNFCRENGIWTGLGRGSAAGCLISYLLGIVRIDPLQYDLLFERFLNEGRVGKSMPDIDNDIQGSRRDEVKRYIENKYGKDYVTSIGTYGTFKLRAALKDLIREMGGDGKEATYISAIVDGEDNFFNLFKTALQPTVNKRLKRFIQKHALQIDQIPLIFNQPKNASIHAAGIVIVPKDNGEIYEQLPVKHIDGIVVSEWEGDYIDQVGFLKCDILGLKQLDKFSEIVSLIKENRGEDISFEDISLDEPEVYYLFQQGFNEDIFQFGGGGLKGYCKELKPDNIEDLIATVALYRPGPIEIGAHVKYAEIKNGVREPEYDYGLEEITKTTYSTIVYQEQIMKIVQHLGGFTLVEADDIRKAMGKKLPEVMAKYKERFIEGSVERGCPRLTAENIWFKMEGFAGYAFNRSHAACYAITGYYSQWFKAKYPLEFWLISLKYSSHDEIQSRISEIKATAGINIVGPNVLKSHKQYVGDINTNSIYWSLNSISHVSDAATDEIIRLRDVEKKFIASFEDFYNIVQESKEAKKAAIQAKFLLDQSVEKERIKSPINKRVINHMIICGAFDDIEKIGIGGLYKRGDLLKRFYCILYPDLKLAPFSVQSPEWQRRVANEELLSIMDYKSDYQWIMIQKQLCGFGDVNFSSLLPKTADFTASEHLFKTNIEVASLYRAPDKVSDERVVVGGIVQSIVERKSKNGPFVQVLIHDGEKELYVTIWNEIYFSYKREIDNSGGKILFINGVVNFDKYKGTNVLHSKFDSKVNILN